MYQYTMAYGQNASSCNPLTLQEMKLEQGEMLLITFKENKVIL